MAGIAQQLIKIKDTTDLSAHGAYSDEVTMVVDRQMLDADFCLQKEAEYYAKAGRAYDSAIKAALEATAREFAQRAKRLKDRKPL